MIGKKEYKDFENAILNLIKVIESDIIKIDIDCRKTSKSCIININKEEKIKIKL
jgi:hypothetical protein